MILLCALSLMAGNAPERSLPPQVLTLLDCAATAPSSHNSQPWRVLFQDDSSLRIEIDPKRRLPAVDPEGREALLSLGAFWETLEAAAPSHGFEVEGRIVPQEHAPLAVAITVRLHPRPIDSGDALRARIAERATNRAPFDTIPLRPEHLQSLRRAAPGLSWFPKQSPQGAWIAQALVEANRQQAQDDARQRELGDWLRFSRREARERADGLTPEMMGKGAFAQGLWYGILGRQDVLKPWFRSASAATAKDQVEGCAGFLVLESPDASPASLLLAGREFQRLTLHSQTLGICLHPMSQLMEESPWKDSLPTRLDLRGNVQFVLRAGYAAAPQRRSLRRPASTFATWER